MLSPLIARTLVVALVMPVLAEAQTKPPTSVTLTGCIDAKRGARREITFEDATTGSRYRLTGKGIEKFLGTRVEIVGGSSGKGLTIRGGLLPSPNIAAQGGAIDPAQESIARQPGGAASGTGEQLREFPVARIRALDGACG